MRSSRPRAKRFLSRLSGFTLLVFIAFVGFYALRVVRFGMGIRRLWEMHEFYTELLEVPEVRLAPG